MPQTYIELDEIGVLHRANEVTRPRWRQDPVYKLVIGTKGAISYETTMSKLNMRSGQFVLFNPVERHRQIRCPEEKLLLEFSPKVVNEVTSEMFGQSAIDLRFNQIPTFHRELTRMATALMAELYNPLPGQRLMLEHLALQCFVLAVRSVQSPESDAVLDLDTPGVEKALHMMMECYRDPLSLEYIAQYADMSKFSLIRQFREVVGVTPYEWLQRYRLRRVCEDLVKTERKVLDIALDHGFSNVSTLNRQFRRLCGSSPTKWRRLHQ